MADSYPTVDRSPKSKRQWRCRYEAYRLEVIIGFQLQADCYKTTLNAIFKNLVPYE